MKIAIIPARGGSKRIPRKNIKEFFGKPIIAYSIEVAQQCGLFDEIIVSTDDQAIAEVARTYGALIPFMRPANIADDYAPIMDVLKNAADWYAKEGKPISYMCCIYATAPFVQSMDVTAGFRALEQSEKRSSMSVAKFTYPIQRALQLDREGGLEMIDKTHLLTRSQDLPEAYMDAAQFIWTTPGAVNACKISLLEQGVAPVVIPTNRVQDIDTPEDWDRAEILYKVMLESCFDDQRISAQQ